MGSWACCVPACFCSSANLASSSWRCCSDIVGIADGSPAGDDSAAVVAVADATGAATVAAVAAAAAAASFRASSSC